MNPFALQMYLHKHKCSHLIVYKNINKKHKTRYLSTKPTFYFSEMIKKGKLKSWFLRSLRSFFRGHENVLSERAFQTFYITKNMFLRFVGRFFFGFFVFLSLYFLYFGFCIFWICDVVFRVFTFVFYFHFFIFIFW